MKVTKQYKSDGTMNRVLLTMTPAEVSTLDHIFTCAWDGKCQWGKDHLLGEADKFHRKIAGIAGRKKNAVTRNRV